MGNFWKQPVFVGIFLLALLSAIVWSYVDKRRAASLEKKNQPAVEAPKIVNLTNVDPTDFDSAIKDEYALAGNKAALENPLNKLAAVEIELPKDLLPNSGNSRYVFSAENDKENNWIITVSQASSSYIRALIPKADYLGDLAQMNTKFWKFNYVTALQIAEKSGGLDWREKNGDFSGVELTLKHTLPKGWLVWTVEYSGKSGTFKKVIDANSGQIIEDDQNTSSQ